MFKDERLPKNSQKSKENKRIILRNIIADRTIRQQHQIHDFIKNTKNIQNHINQPKVNSFSYVEEVQIGATSLSDQALKLEIQQLRNSCSRLQTENQLLKEENGRIKKIKEDNKTNFQISTQTEIQQTKIRFYQNETMTDLTLSNICLLEDQFLKSNEQNNKLFAHLQFYQEALDEINIQLKYEKSKTNRYENQIFKSKTEIEIMKIELTKIRKNTITQQKTVSMGTSTVQQIGRQEFYKREREIQCSLSEQIKKISQFIEEEGIIEYTDNIIQGIKQTIKNKVERSLKPLQEEIMLIKQMMRSQAQKYGDEESKLHKLLSEARNTIQKLMTELRNSNKEAKDYFLQKLKSQRLISKTIQC